MSVNILSLDLSTKRTGYAIAKDEKLEGYGCITAESRDQVARILKMRNEVIEIIKQNEINEVVIEEVPTMPSTYTYKLLVWLQAAIVFGIYEYDKNIPISYIYPSEWRSVLKIKQGRGVLRQTVKQEDIEYVKNRFGVDVKDDEADALCLLSAYLLGINKEINW